MTDEVAADDIAAKLAREIPPDVVWAITCDVVDSIAPHVRDRQRRSKRMNSRRSEYAASIDLKLVTSVASHLRGLPGFPAKMPGTALKRLVAALIDRHDGKDEPMLAPRRNDGKPALGRPTLPLNTQLDRVEPAVAMELLMAKTHSRLRMQRRSCWTCCVTATQQHSSDSGGRFTQEEVLFPQRISRRWWSWQSARSEILE